MRLNQKMIVQIFQSCDSVSQNDAKFYIFTAEAASPFYNIDPKLLVTSFEQKVNEIFSLLQIWSIGGPFNWRPDDVRKSQLINAYFCY